MLTPAIYSSTVISFSLQKSCKCLVKLGITCASRGFALGPVASMTLSVKAGSNRDTLVVLALAPAVPFALPFTALDIFVGGTPGVYDLALGPR